MFFTEKSCLRLDPPRQTQVGLPLLNFAFTDMFGTNSNVIKLAVGGCSDHHIVSFVIYGPTNAKFWQLAEGRRGNGFGSGASGEPEEFVNAQHEAAYTIFCSPGNCLRMILPNCRCKPGGNC